MSCYVRTIDVKSNMAKPFYSRFPNNRFPAFDSAFSGDQSQLMACEVFFNSI